jgi:hypothetical protein
MKYGGGAMQVPGIQAGSGGVDDVMRDRCDTLKEFVARFKDSLIWGPYQKTSFRHGIYTALPYFLAAVGALVSPFGGMVVAGFSGSGADPTVIQTFSILSPVFSIVSLALFYFGMRMLQPHLEALKLQNVLVDPRSPVLFLRGFSRDGEVFDDPTKLPLLLPQRWSPEEIVCHILQTVGPVVAVGRPTDRLPRIGAMRLYIKEEDWKPVVKDLLRRCSLVIVRVGQSRGLLWEMRHIVSGGHLPKAVFMLVDENGFPYGRCAYESFRENLQQEVGISMPTKGWKSWFIRFGPNNTVRAVPGERPWIGGHELNRKTWELLGAFPRLRFLISPDAWE